MRLKVAVETSLNLSQTIEWNKKNWDNPIIIRIFFVDVYVCVLFLDHFSIQYTFTSFGKIPRTPRIRNGIKNTAAPPIALRGGMWQWGLGRCHTRRSSVFTVNVFARLLLNEKIPFCSAARCFLSLLHTKKKSEWMFLLSNLLVCKNLKQLTD